MIINKVYCKTCGIEHNDWIQAYSCCKLANEKTWDRNQIVKKEKSKLK